MSDTLNTLATIIRHRDSVRLQIQRVTQELERRALRHDISKLSLEELAGFSEINRVAREHPIGTPEYEASMRSCDVLDLHFSRNSHHPEFHGSVEEMGWMDLLEMVLDWHGAAATYGTNSVRDSLEYHRERHGFTDEQWWLVMQIVEWMEVPE